jgi:PAS domain-containing protein
VDQQKPLGLILARNFLTSLSTPAFLVETGGTLIFWNEAAGALLGMSFEEYGRKPADEWGRALGPFDADGNPIPLDDLPTTQAVREGRPAHAEFTIHSVNGTEHEIEASAVPIVEDGDQEGAMVFFWSRRNGAAA